MKRFKNFSSFACVVASILLCILPVSHQQFQTFDWPTVNAPKWENSFNSLFSFESSRISPHSNHENGLVSSNPPGYARLFFEMSPKPQQQRVLPPSPVINLIHSDPSGAPYMSQPPKERPRNLPREINITQERLGGYGGSGDLRGYGAYEYKHKVIDNDFPMPMIDILRAPTKKIARRKKPFVETFFNILPMEDI